MEPTNSIAICTYNRLEHLKKSLGSVIKSAARPTELIIVDDCSTEVGIREYLEEVKRVHEREDFKIYLCFLNENVGHCEAQNRAFEMAHTDILIHFESDIVINYEGWNKVFEDYLNRYPELGLVGPYGSSRQDVIIRPLPAAKKPVGEWTEEDYQYYMNVCRMLYKNYVNNVSPRPDYLQCMWLLGGVFAIKRKAYDETELVDSEKGWSKNLSHQREVDFALKVRMTPSGYQVGEIREFQYEHLGEGDFAETPERKAQIREGVWNFLKKWNRRFLGYWDYDSIHAMSWDDFPPNEWFRRQAMALYGWNRTPSQVNLPFGWGKWDEIKITRPPGRENEKALLQEMVNNKWYKDYGKLGDRDNVEWKDLLIGKEKEFWWSCK